MDIGSLRTQDFIRTFDLKVQILLNNHFSHLFQDHFQAGLNDYEVIDRGLGFSQLCTQERGDAETYKLAMSDFLKQYLKSFTRCRGWEPVGTDSTLDILAGLIQCYKKLIPIEHSRQKLISQLPDPVKQNINIQKLAFALTQFLGDLRLTSQHLSERSEENCQQKVFAKLFRWLTRQLEQSPLNLEPAQERDTQTVELYSDRLIYED